MIIALNEHAHWKISDQFKDRTIQKEYIALTWRQWKEQSGIIENILGRNKKNPIQFESSDTGKKALSHFELIKAGEYLSAVRFFPKQVELIKLECIVKNSDFQFSEMNYMEVESKNLKSL